MKNARRNDPCPCGSGRKYKRCCGDKQPSPFQGPTAGLRMKGGIRFDPTAKGYLVIVHIWDNVECQGEPQEWSHPKIFQSEQEAMDYYQTAIGPPLKQMLEKTSEGNKDVAFVHRKLEEWGSR